MDSIELPQIQWVSTPNISVPTGSARDWILSSASSVGGDAWVLCFSINGLTWGRVQDGTLSDSSQDFGAYSPGFQNLRLVHEIYVFSESGQVHAWKEGGQWHAAEIVEGRGQATDFFDEALFLWGTSVLDTQNNFYLLKDGLQGLNHALPLDQPPHNLPGRAGMPRLVTRCYLGRDMRNGAAFIAANRLVVIDESQEAK